MKALTTLSKHVDPGAFSAGTQRSTLEKMMMQAKQDNPMQQILGAMGQGQGQGQPPSAPPQAPQPGG